MAVRVALAVPMRYFAPCLASSARLAVMLEKFARERD
jgi:hypothetical protein